MWSWFGRNEVQIKIIFAIVAAMYVVFEYRMNVWDDKISRTLDYIKQYNSGEILEASVSLNSFWISDEATNFFTNVTPENYTREIIMLIIEKQWYDEIYKLHNFYSDLSMCANNSICDVDTACEFFFDDIQSFRETYRVFLEDVSGKWGEDISSEVQTFVKTRCQTQFKSYCTELPESPYCKPR